MHRTISKEYNGKSRVEYEMFKKQWLINGIFSEKAKKEKRSTFLELESEFFSKFNVKKIQMRVIC